METNEQISKSECNIFPRGNNVLIKMLFKASVLDLSSGKPSDKSDGEKVDYYVAGFGPAVKDLTIGDKVILKLEPYQKIEVAGNNKSIDVLSDFFSPRNMKSAELQVYIKETPKVDVVEYGLFPEFIIKANIK